MSQSKDLCSSPISSSLIRYITEVYGDCDNDKGNNPYSLYVAPEDHLKQCYDEAENDVRHMGRFVWFEYFCPDCGTKAVCFPPDYPYCSPNSQWTCDTCASVMRLMSLDPILGELKECGKAAFIRNNV